MKARRTINKQPALRTTTLRFHFLFISYFLIFISGYSQVINRAEYFIDTDPGNGNGTAVTVSSPGSAVNFNFNIPIGVLSNGFHVVGFRIRESITGNWSQSQFGTFYVIPAVPTNNAVNLIAGEYFFNADPGFGNGTSFPVTASPTIAIPLNNVSIGSLSPGFHTMSFRFKDDKGKWTHAHTQSIYVIPPSVSINATSLTRAEYFFDADPGVGNGTSLPISAGSPQNNNFPITLPGSLTPGFHNIGFRYRDNLNRWTHAEYRTFYIMPLSAPSAQIVAAHYFVDDIQGTGTPKSISGITPGATLDQLVALDMTGVPTGPHTLSIRLKDSNGYWSYLETQNFTVSSCIPPPSPTAPGVSRCDAGTLNLVASGATGTQVYRWYDDPILNTLVSTGETFTTPSITATRNYYVSIFDSSTNCESARVTVEAKVTILPKPTINPAGSISFCAGSSLFLSAPAGFSQYVWSTGATTQQIVVTTAGSFTVQVGDGSCTSVISDAVTTTIAPAPTKPVITIGGNTTICGTGSVSLTGPAGFEYIWSTGATTQAISVSQSGVYFLLIKNAGANCSSLPSDPVVVTVLTPPCGGTTNQPPVINPNPFASQIEGRVEVDLTKIISDVDNNLDFSTLRIINNLTSRGVPAIIDASYFLQIDYSGNPFTGVDRVTLEVCDLVGACAQQVIDIDVVGAIVVYNGVTPDNDGYNDFMLLKYIDVVEGAAENKVTIFNRWGDVVFDIENYNNTDRVFAGLSNSGDDLPSGTYYYKIEFVSGSKPMSGFLTLIR